MLPCLATQSLRCLGVLLDEPANDLDMTSVRQLPGALRSYPGAPIVASRVAPFLRGLGLTRWLRTDGELADIDPLQGSLALPAKALRRPARSWVR